MNGKKRFLRLMIGLMTTAILTVNFVPAVSYADEMKNSAPLIMHTDKQPKKARVVVSMGDSYSAGEGISPFYSNGSNPSVPEFCDWLAHRSKYSWPGQLYLNNNKNDPLKNHKASYTSTYDENDDVHWYFVASSGAETIDIISRKQPKPYTTSKGSIFDAELEPQINVLKFLKQQGIVPDYITLTLGGNDLGFAGKIATAVTENAHYKNKGKLYDELKEAETKLNSELKEKLKNTYKEINNVVSDGDNQPCIIVVDYPNLLDTSKDHPVFTSIDAKWDNFFFTKEEAEMINEKVDVFNKAIYDVVNECKIGDQENSGLNIEFVDVSGTVCFKENSKNTFKGHEAYSSDPWINGVMIKQFDDLDFIIEEPADIVSAYSIHPNRTGAEMGYAKCVQEKINELEAKREKTKPVAESTIKHADTPTPALKPEISVTDAINKTYTTDYDEYTWKIPKVSISGKNTEHVNSEILEKLSCKESDVKYSYFVGDEVISILAEIQSVEDGGDFHYEVFNISIETGEFLSGDQVVKSCGSTDKDFFALVEIVYEKAYEDNVKIWDNGPYYRQNEKIIESYIFVFPYINTNGKLCFVVGIYGPLPDGYGWINFDASTNKYLIDQDWGDKWVSI